MMIRPKHQYPVNVQKIDNLFHLKVCNLSNDVNEHPAWSMEQIGVDYSFNFEFENPKCRSENFSQPSYNVAVAVRLLLLRIKLLKSTNYINAKK